MDRTRTIAIVALGLSAAFLVGGCGLTDTGEQWDLDDPYEVSDADQMRAYDMGTAVQRYAIDAEIGELEVCLRLQLTDSEDSREPERVAVDMPEDWTFAASLYETPCSEAESDQNLISGVESAEGSVELLEEDDGSLEGFDVDVDVVFDHERDEVPVRYLVAGEVALK